jgi:hypothetical protein
MSLLLQLQNLRQNPRMVESCHRTKLLISLSEPGTNQETDTAEEAAVPAVAIPRRHPLFGLWEGSFKVSNAKGPSSPTNCLIATGPDEEIAETFFICSFNGERGDDATMEPVPRVMKDSDGSIAVPLTNEASLPDQFSELPPDPRVCRSSPPALSSHEC